MKGGEWGVQTHTLCTVLGTRAGSGIQPHYKATNKSQ